MPPRNKSELALSPPEGWAKGVRPLSRKQVNPTELPHHQRKAGIEAKARGDLPSLNIH